MTTCVGHEALVAGDETYWVDTTAASPVLLIDEATEAITEALYRARCGSVLDDRDLAAAGIALGDLFGGLSQLAELLSTSLDKDTQPDRPHPGGPGDRLATLRARVISAQQAAHELRRDSTAPCPTSDHETIPRQRA